jgi:hypothetical protein
MKFQTPSRLEHLASLLASLWCLMPANDAVVSGAREEGSLLSRAGHGHDCPIDSKPDCPVVESKPQRASCRDPGTATASGTTGWERKALRGRPTQHACARQPPRKGGCTCANGWDTVFTPGRLFIFPHVRRGGACNTTAGRECVCVSDCVCVSFCLCFFTLRPQGANPELRDDQR